MEGCSECPCRSGTVAKNRNERQFKDDLNYLLTMMKVQYGVSRRTMLAQFCDYMEERGEHISDEILNAYLGGRANFPFTMGIFFLNFLADFDNGKRRKHPQVQEFVRKWYFPMISSIQRFIDAGRELKREYEEKARMYGYNPKLE